MLSFKENNSEGYIFVVSTLIVIFLILVGAWLRISNLGKINFQNDEYYHVEAAVGYLETGKFALWDFLEEKTTGLYTRAWPYTWLVAQSFKIFGVSEWSARLPSAVFGILLLPLIYWLGWQVSQSRLVGLLSLLLVTFDNSFIWSSRVCRMYSMLVFFVLLSVWLIYRGLNPEKKLFNFYYLIPGIFLLSFSYIIHEVTLLLVLSFFIYFLFNIRRSKKYIILALIFFIGGIIFLIINYFVTPLMSADFITWRWQPNWEYFYYPFNQLRAVYVGWFIFILGVILLWQQKNDIKIYYLSLFLPVILFMTFFAHRYAAKKYILFVLPFILIFYVDSFYQLIKKLVNNKLFYLIFITLFLFVGPLFSWPGVKPNLLFQQARADQNYDNFRLHNYAQAYSYIEQNYNYQDHEPILILQKRSYYFHNKNLNFVSLKKNQEFTLTELKVLMQKNKSGWVVWPKYKNFHLNDKFKKYCKNNLKEIKEVKATNIKVYRWPKK